MSTPTTDNSHIQVVDAPALPRPAAPRSPSHLTEEQVRFFDEHGYLILRDWIGGELLARLQQAGHDWISLGEALSQAADPGQVAPDLDPQVLGDFVFAKRPNGDVMFRVNYVHNKGQQASLELLGSPQVLGVAESLCGPNFVPTYESMVFKKKGDGEQIPWHQDAVHPRRFRVFNFDLYLDASRVGSGALRVVPGSQARIHDVCEVRDVYGWDPPGVIHVEMQPGDVLLHDVMVLHGSERVEGKALRRTIYYEFRSAEEILADGPWDAAWIEKRLRLIPVGLRAYRARFPDAPQFTWNVADEYRPAPLGDAGAELKVAHLIHSPGAYCSAGNAGKSN